MQTTVTHTFIAQFTWWSTEHEEIICQQCKIGENVTDKTPHSFSLISHKIHHKVSKYYSRMNKIYISLEFIT